MATTWFSCQACSESDPTQDTVKVDPNLLNKENVQPLQLTKAQTEEQRRREAMEEATRKSKEEESVKAASMKAQQEAARQEAAKRVAARREAEEAARREAVQAKRLEAEEIARREAAELAAAERARREEEATKAAAAVAEMERREEARVAEEQEQRVRKEAEGKVQTWCRQNGFQDMHTQKKTFRGATKYPLHTAVKYNNQEMVKMMILSGACKDVKDSRNQTPGQLAFKLNKNGSHDEILRLLP